MPSSGDLNRWRRDLLTEFDPDDFYHREPLEFVRDAKHGPIPMGTHQLTLPAESLIRGVGVFRGKLALFA
jgi:hypothetical protein